jgi:hypothetical protein
MLAKAADLKPYTLHPTPYTREIVEKQQLLAETADPKP